MEFALNTAIIIISVVLIGLVVIQSRSAGLSNRGESIHRTKRGLEKTMHQLTIGIAVVFLLLSLFVSLPLAMFDSTPASPPINPGLILLLLT